MKTFIFFTLTIAIALIIGCKNSKEEVVDQLYHYRDSLGFARLQLFLVDTSKEHGATDSELVNMRAPIYKRIYAYTWKIDSLEMELKKY